MTMSKKNTFSYYKNCDIRMKYSISRDTKRNRYRAIVSLEDQTICKTTVSHYGKNRQQLERAAKTTYADELYTKLPPGVFCAVKTTADLSTGMTINTVLAVNGEYIWDQIKFKDKNRIIDITQSLCARLSTKSIHDLTPSDCLDAVNSYIAQSNPQTLEDEERLRTTCNEVLKLVFGYCVTIGVISSNPIRYLKKKMTSEDAIKKQMRLTSLTVQQEKDIFSYLREDGYKDPRKFGMVLRLLTGLTSQEVCGLRFGDLHPMNQLTARMPDGRFDTPQDCGDYVLVISRVHSKIHGKFQVNEPINSQSVFRILPISDICLQQIIVRIKHLHKVYKLNNDTIHNLPMVCEYGEGEDHLHKFGRPDNLGKYINKILANQGIKQEDFYIPTLDKRDKEEFKVLTLPVNSRILRTHFEYQAKHVCGLTEGEIDYLLSTPI